MEQHLPDVRNLNLGSDISEDEVENSDDEHLESEIIEKQLPITADEVERNYNLMGTLSQPEAPVVTLDQLKADYPQAFTPLSETALASVLAELCLPFSLSPFQVSLFIHPCGKEFQ